MSSRREEWNMLSSLPDSLSESLHSLLDGREETVVHYPTSSRALDSHLWPLPPQSSDAIQVPGSVPQRPAAGSNPNWAWLPQSQPDSYRQEEAMFGSGENGRSQRRGSGNHSGSLEASLAKRNSASQGSLDQTKSFKELHAEKNKQAQRRFRKRQKEKLQELQEKLSRVEAERSDLELQNAHLNSACQLRTEELRKVRERQSQAAEAEEDELSQAFKGGVTLTFRETERITLTPDQIKTMSEDDLARYWSNYVKELAVLLVAVEGAPDPPPTVLARVQELVQRELLFLYIRAALTNMQSVKKFIAKAKIEESALALGSNGTPNRWREVSRALQLSPEQSAAVVQSWHAFVERVGHLLTQRSEIHRRMCHTAHASTSCQESAEKYVEALDLIDQLKKNLRAEHVLIHEFLVDWYLRRLTTMQMARCFVRSFPFYPDIPAIAAWIAVAEKDGLAISKLPIMEATASPASSA